MRPLPRPLRIIHTPADDVTDVPAVSGDANTSILFEITLRISVRYTFSRFGFENVLDQQTNAYGTCALIIFQFDCTCIQLGVNIVR
jgi:hypothetical protein